MTVTMTTSGACDGGRVVEDVSNLQVRNMRPSAAQATTAMIWSCLCLIDEDLKGRA